MRTVFLTRDKREVIYYRERNRHLHGNMDRCRQRPSIIVMQANSQMNTQSNAKQILHASFDLF
jgi:hypothetical protein